MISKPTKQYKSVLLIDIGGDRELKEAKTEEQLSEYLYERLIDDLNQLNKLPSRILENIDEILFTSLPNEVLTFYYYDLIRQVIPELKKRKEYKRISHLLAENKYYYTTDEDRILSITQDSEIVVVESFISAISLIIYCNTDKLIGYRRIIDSEGIAWEQIADINKYILVVAALYLLNKSEAEFLELARFTIEEYAAKVKFKNKFWGRNRFRFCFLAENEKYDQLISALQKAVGPLNIVECKKDSYDLKGIKGNLLIISFENLSSGKQMEFYNNIVMPEYNDRLIIILDRTPEELVGYPPIIDETIFPDDLYPELNPSELLFIRVRPVINTIVQSYNNTLNFINNTVTDKKEKDKLLRKQLQFQKMGERFNSEAVNFWYSNDVGQTIKYLDAYSYYHNEIKKRFYNTYKIKIHRFQIKHDYNKQEWEIIKDNEVLRKIDYNRSSGLKYLVYLYKHYTEKSIAASELRKIIHKWNNEEEVSTTDTGDARKISQDLFYLFDKQCTELSPIQDCIIISSKDPGCYFESKQNIIIEINDREIPPPHK